jgi:threonine/homoserine/homoserine lactone efflux protein
MKLQDLLLWGGAAWLLWMFAKPQAPGIDIPETPETTPEEYFEELI